MSVSINPVDYVASRLSGMAGDAAPRLAAQAAARAQQAGDGARAALWRQVETALKAPRGHLGRHFDIRA